VSAFSVVVLVGLVVVIGLVMMLGGLIRERPGAVRPAFGA